MAKTNLSDDDLKILSDCINNQTEVPEELLLKLSPTFFERIRELGKFDYNELDKFKIPIIEYAGKRPESVILAQAAITGGASPLQVERCFYEGKQTNQTNLDLFESVIRQDDSHWRNMIVQGDNLQFLKTCYMDRDPLIKGKVKGEVKLIYIDPPFATEGDFRGKEGQASYSDQIDRSEFLEALRERLIYLRELLADDGTIYVHSNQSMLPYIRLIMDEVFQTNNHLNDLIWHFENKPKFSFSKVLPGDWECIICYAKKFGHHIFEHQLVPVKEVQQQAIVAWDPVNKKRVAKRDEEGNIIYETRTVKLMGAVWVLPIIHPSAHERLDYPTQKPESVLERIIRISSKPDDLIFDCFAGSGTTAAVAEKYGCRWIVCDFGKHAIYTMQKRILTISDSSTLEKNNDSHEKRCEKCGSVIEESGNYKYCTECNTIVEKVGSKKKKKYGKSPKPFIVLSTGAYDFSKIMNLRQNQDAYITFVLGLFGITREEIDYAKKYKLSNIYAEKDNNPVEIYPVWADDYLKDIRIDEDYLNGILEASGCKLKGNYYLITPETCTVIGDTTLKNRNNETVNFKLLKFPYKVLEDISRHFSIEEQPSSSADINNLISSTGFYFNEEVSVKTKRVIRGFQISELKTNILNKNKELYKELDGLAMVLIDNKYDGKVFNMDTAIYAKDIGEDGAVKVDGLTDKSHVIVVDKHGNESKITKI